MKQVIVIAFFLLMGAILLNSLPPGDEEMVVSTVQRFFTVMEMGNSAEAQKVFFPGGISLSIRKEGKTDTIKISNFQEFITKLPGVKDRCKKEMSNPRVLVHKDIAVLWTGYHFYVSGRFSHCGVDAFSLIKTDEGWKIASLVYTVEKEDCTQ